MHAAQALVNTLPRHALPGLGRDGALYVSAAEPATEVLRLAAVAPARSIALPPTSLRHCLRRLADGSRMPTPEGSLLARGWGDVATPLRSITEQQSLPPASFSPLPSQVITQVERLVVVLGVCRVAPSEEGEREGQGTESMSGMEWTTPEPDSSDLGLLGLH